LIVAPNGTRRTPTEPFGPAPAFMRGAPVGGNSGWSGPFDPGGF
jgi:hypothetical protein